MERCAERDWTIYLQTGPRKRDIFQVGYTAAGSSGLVFPLDINQIRAQHSWFNTAIQHNLLVLSDTRRWSISAIA